MQDLCEPLSLSPQKYDILKLKAKGEKDDNIKTDLNIGKTRLGDLSCGIKRKARVKNWSEVISLYARLNLLPDG